MKKIFIIIFLILIFPAITFAEDVLVFEFSPDYALPQALLTNQQLVQSFISATDGIKSLDLWVDNAGAAGNISVSILDDNNTVLASKTVSVATLNPFYTGNKINIPFNTSISLAPARTYKIKIQSEAPKLRIYGLNKIQLVEHNAPNSVSSLVGDATIDSIVQDFAIKFSILKSVDSRGPIISNVVVTSRDSATNRITFNIDELSDYKFIYGQAGTQNISTINYSGFYSTCIAGIYNCYIDFSVSSGIEYTYRLFAKDRFGNETVYESVFQSLNNNQNQNQNENPNNNNQNNTNNNNNQNEIQPVLIALSLSNAKISFLSSNSITLYWQTNIASNSQLKISTDSLGQNVIATVFDNTLELMHNLSADNLLPHAKYFAYISSKDSSNRAVAQTLPFETLSNADNVNPPIIPPREQLVITPTQTGNQISWGISGNNNILGYKVDVFDTNYNLVKTTEVSKDRNKINITKNDLKNGEYAVIVYQKNEDGTFQKISDPTKLTVKNGLGDIFKSPVFYISIVVLLIILGVVGFYITQNKSTKK